MPCNHAIDRLVPAPVSRQRCLHRFTIQGTCRTARLLDYFTLSSSPKWRKSGIWNSLPGYMQTSQERPHFPKIRWSVCEINTPVMKGYVYELQILCYYNHHLDLKCFNIGKNITLSIASDCQNMIIWQLLLHFIMFAV